MSNKNVWVIIPAAGVGARMQADRPKQYLPLAGKTVIEHTLACFSRHPAIAGIVVAISDSDSYWESLYPNLGASLSVPLHAAPGGNERADSVLNALDFLHDELLLKDEAVVMVHDAARPCLPYHDLDQLVSVSYVQQVSAILAVPVRDTMKRAQPGSCHIAHTEDRDGLWHALTPQMAPLGELRHALKHALSHGAKVTDEASALEFAGLHPLLVEGDARNIKITRPADLALAEFFLRHA